MPLDLLALGILTLFVKELAPNIVGGLFAELATRRIDTELQKLNIGNHDLALALRRAYLNAVSAISAGLRQQYGLFEAKVIKEFAQRLDYQYFVPFSAERRLGNEVQTRLRQDSKASCRVLLQQADQVLRLDDIDRTSVQQLLIPISEVRDVAGLEELTKKARMDLLGRMRSLDGIEDLFCDFLAYHDLLMDAVVYFFEAAIKAEPQASALLAHYDVQALRVEVAKLRSDLQSSAPRMPPEQLQTAVQRQDEVEKGLLILEAHSLELNQTFGSFQKVTTETLDRILSEIEEVQVSIDEVNQQMHNLEQAIWAALRARDFEEVVELGTALAELEDRRRRKSGALEHHNVGFENYNKALDVLKSGDREQAMQEFQAAEKSFRAAIDLALETDEYVPMYLTDLGNSLTMQGRTADAIPFYERALRLSKNYKAAVRELHKRMVEMGLQQIDDKQYAIAIDTLEYALVLAPDDASTQHLLALAFNEEANAKPWPDSPKIDRDRSKALMMRAIFYDPTKRLYQNNLRTMQGGKNRPKIVFLPERRTNLESVVESLPTETAPYFEVWHDIDLPEQLRYWLDLLLPEFPELISEPPNRRRPIHVWWLLEGAETEARLESIGLPGQTNVGVALSHYHDGQHYIVLSPSHYAQVDDPMTIIGDLAHELSHEAFKALGAASRLPHWAASAITWSSNERIADLLVIYKGFGPFLQQSRRYLEQKSEGFEGDYPGLIPVEITRYLRRDEEAEAKRKINAGATAKRQGADEEAATLFSAALRTWKRIVEEDPTYAFAWYELSITHDWLDNKDEAVRAVQMAVIIDPNPKYRRWLDALRMSREEEARQLVNDAAEFKKAGNPKPAGLLFRSAEAIWREYLTDYVGVARVHYELGVTLEWQERIPEAQYEFRIAAALDPRNEKYASYLRDVLERYGEQ